MSTHIYVLRLMLQNENDEVMRVCVGQVLLLGRRPICPMAILHHSKDHRIPVPCHSVVHHTTQFDKILRNFVFHGAIHNSLFSILVKTTGYQYHAAVLYNVQHSTQFCEILRTFIFQNTLFPITVGITGN